MKQFYHLTEISNLKVMELIILLVTFIGCLTILGGIRTAPQVLIYIFLLCMNLFLIYIWKMDKRVYPKKYTQAIYILLLILFITLMLSLIENGIMFDFIIILSLFAYIYVFGINIYFILNLIYIFLLKIMFPQEGEMQRDKFDNISLKKLSQYIELDKQKLYFSLTLINLLLYFIFVSYVMLFLLKVIKPDQLGVFEVFSHWVKAQEWLSLFNGISLLSFLIAIYTITFAAQNNILKEGKEKLRDKYIDYV